MSEKTGSKDKGGSLGKSPIPFVILWIGVPLAIIISAALYFKYF